MSGSSKSEKYRAVETSRLATLKKYLQSVYKSEKARDVEPMRLDALEKYLRSGDKSERYHDIKNVLNDIEKYLQSGEPSKRYLDVEKILADLENYLRSGQKAKSLPSTGQAIVRYIDPNLPIELPLHPEGKRTPKKMYPNEDELKVIFGGKDDFYSAGPEYRSGGKEEDVFYSAEPEFRSAKRIQFEPDVHIRLFDKTASMPNPGGEFGTEMSPRTGGSLNPELAKHGPASKSFQKWKQSVSQAREKFAEEWSETRGLEEMEEAAKERRALESRRGSSVGGEEMRAPASARRTSTARELTEAEAAAMAMEHHAAWLESTRASAMEPETSLKQWRPKRIDTEPTVAAEMIRGSGLKGLEPIYASPALETSKRGSPGKKSREVVKKRRPSIELEAPRAPAKRQSSPVRVPISKITSALPKRISIDEAADLIPEFEPRRASPERKRSQSKTRALPKRASPERKRSEGIKGLKPKRGSPAGGKARSPVRKTVAEKARSPVRKPAASPKRGSPAGGKTRSPVRKLAAEKARSPVRKTVVEKARSPVRKPAASPKRGKAPTRSQLHTYSHDMCAGTTEAVSTLLAKLPIQPEKKRQSKADMCATLKDGGYDTEGVCGLSLAELRRKAIKLKLSSPNKKTKEQLCRMLIHDAYQ